MAGCRIIEYDSERINRERQSSLEQVRRTILMAEVVDSSLIDDRWSTGKSQNRRIVQSTLLLVSTNATGKFFRDSG